MENPPKEFNMTKGWENNQNNIKGVSCWRCNLGSWQRETLGNVDFANLISWNTKCFHSFGVKIHPVSKANMGKNHLHAHPLKYFVLQNNAWVELQWVKHWRKAGCTGAARSDLSFLLPEPPGSSFLSCYHHALLLLPLGVALFFSALRQLFTEQKFLPTLLQFLKGHLSSNLIILAHTILFVTVFCNKYKQTNTIIFVTI